MKCISHNEIDAVNNCGNCGAGLCQECVKDTIFEKNNKPLCWNCNVQRALKNDTIFRTDLGIKQITIGVYAVAIVIGLIFFAMGKLFSVRIGNLPPVITMLIFWGIGGIIAGFINRIQSNAGFLYTMLVFFLRELSHRFL